MLKKPKHTLKFSHQRKLVHVTNHRIVYTAPDKDADLAVEVTQGMLTSKKCQILELKDVVQVRYVCV
jgi:hypothetical protein